MSDEKVCLFSFAATYKSDGKKMISSPPFPPPPPLPSDQSADIQLCSDSDDSMNEATPLVGHISRKSEPRNQNIFRAQAALPIVDSRVSDSQNGMGASSSLSDGHDDDDKSLSAGSVAESVASLGSITTVALENFREGLATPFVDEEGSCPKISGGLGSLCIVGTILGLIMPKNQELRGQWYQEISSVIGYNYFVLWSICFYPQVLLNYRRKSTRGLSNDFAILNFMGWVFYSAYVSSMFFDEEIVSMYEERFGNAESTVQSNDVAFAVHAMILSFIYLVQILYYGGNGCALPLKPQTWILVLGMGIPSAAVPLLIQVGVLAYSRWLDYFYVLSFFKICCTLTKYAKQVMLNWKRKSTSGWNIWYNFLECSGGSLSMLQICLDSLDMQDITGITGNIAKFALGFATIFFDAIFFTQHYILYSSSGPKENQQSAEEIPSIIRSNNVLDVSGQLTDAEIDLAETMDSTESTDNSSLGGGMVNVKTLAIHSVQAPWHTAEIISASQRSDGNTPILTQL